MFTRRIYIVATNDNGRDVRIVRVYDGQLFTQDTIIHGLLKQLKGLNTQVSIQNADQAYIDVINEDNELDRTYSIIAHNAMLSNKDFN